MSIIKEHNIILEGNDDIVLVPLTDEHLPLLYQWNADVEVLYWGEGDDVTEPYDEEMVKLIYGSVSQNAYCFLIQKEIQNLLIRRMAVRMPDFPYMKVY